MDWAPGQQCRRVRCSAGGAAMCAGTEGQGAPRVFRFRSNRQADERGLQVPQSATLFPELDLPEAGAVARFFHLTCAARGQRRGQSSGLFGRSPEAFRVSLGATGISTLGNPVAPVLKISSNSDLARRVRDMIQYLSEEAL